jgi:hypothetical protein
MLLSIHFMQLLIAVVGKEMSIGIRHAFPWPKEIEGMPSHDLKRSKACRRNMFRENGDQ